MRVCVRICVRVCVRVCVCASNGRDLDCDRGGDRGGDRERFSHLADLDLVSYFTADPPAGLREPVCRSRVDVGFIVDSSGSVASDYPKEKEFVKTIGNSLDIAEDGSHAGIVVFSSNSEVAMKFSESNNGSAFATAVDKLPLLRGRTRIDKALKLAFDRLFREEDGMRLDVPKVLVLLTDGAQTVEDGAIAPSKAVEPFHEANIKVLVIGIGSGVKKDELRSVVKSDNDLYLAEDFDKLTSTDFTNSVSGAACVKGKQ